MMHAELSVSIACDAAHRRIMSARGRARGAHACMQIAVFYTHLPVLLSGNTWLCTARDYDRDMRACVRGDVRIIDRSRYR